MKGIERRIDAHTQKIPTLHLNMSRLPNLLSEYEKIRIREGEVEMKKQEYVIILPFESGGGNE